MRAGRALRKVIIDRLSQEVTALSGRIYARSVPETAVYPYCTIGPSYWTPRNAECIPARSQTVQVNLWHRAGADGEAEDLVDDVSAALEGWADASTLTMGPMRVALARVMDDPSGDLHGVVQVEALIEG